MNRGNVILLLKLLRKKTVANEIRWVKELWKPYTTEYNYVKFSLSYTSIPHEKGKHVVFVATNTKTNHKIRLRTCDLSGSERVAFVDLWDVVSGSYERPVIPEDTVVEEILEALS